MLRRIIVEAKLRLDRNFRRPFAARLVAALQQWLQRRLAIHHISQTPPESIDFCRIQLQRSMQVRKVKCIDHDTRRVRERIRLDNVHAPSSQHARDRCKERRPVRRHQRQRKRASRGTQFHLYRLSLQLPVHRDVLRNVARRMNRKIPPRQTFEEPFDLFSRSASQHDANLLEQ